ncbi:MAG: glycosyltransferase [Acidimicrobiales bacterium]
MAAVGSGAVFVVCTSTARQQGPVAALLSTAGWASAAQRVLGASWITAPGGLVEPEQARRQASAPHLASPEAPTWRRRVPTVAKTVAKDLRQARRVRALRIDPDGPWRDTELSFVWQRHELFHAAGIGLARALDVPAVLFVPATLVWEAQQWGVTRPGWGRRLERWGEEPALRAADLVACGSEAVAEQAVRLGTDPARVLVTPTGVDLDLFDAPATDRGVLRRGLGLEDRFVVGWVGSFRRFHAVEQIIDALAGVERAALLLVGDGPERRALEERARERGVDAVFTGTVDHSTLVAHLGVMDAAVVLAPTDRSFHYSPLKLAEYLAAGLPVVAPAVAQVRDRLTDGVDALLVAPGNGADLTDALVRLRDDPASRARIGAAARAAAVRTWGWDHQVRRVLDALG